MIVSKPRDKMPTGDDADAAWFERPALVARIAELEDALGSVLSFIFVHDSSWAGELSAVLHSSAPATPAKGCADPATPELVARIAELEAGISKLIAANDKSLAEFAPRPDIAWRDLKLLVAEPADAPLSSSTERAYLGKVVSVDLDADDMPTAIVRFHTGEEDARSLAGLMIDGRSVRVVVPKDAP
jgi:hypothetical protein